MYFPLFLDLSEKEILVAGAGRIALRRVRSLCGFAGHITVVAPQISQEFDRLGLMRNDEAKTDLTDTKQSGDTEVQVRTFECENTRICICCRCFEESDLKDKDLVLAATDDAGLNQKIFDLCRARGIPVNVCSDASLCDFQFPSVVENGAVVVGINASGRDHRLVKETRKRVESLFHDPHFKSKYESFPG